MSQTSFFDRALGWVKPVLYLLCLPVMIISFAAVMAIIGTAYVAAVVLWPFQAWRERQWFQKMRQAGRVLTWSDTQHRMRKSNSTLIIVLWYNGSVENAWHFDGKLYVDGSNPALVSLADYRRAVKALHEDARHLESRSILERI